MQATVLLCDYAEAVNGKLYVMGGGWNVAFAADQPMNAALAILVIVPWDRTNQKHELRVESPASSVTGEPYLLQKVRGTRSAAGPSTRAATGAPNDARGARFLPIA